MKKTILILLAAFIVMFGQSPVKEAKAESLYYAKVQSSGVQFYSTPNEDNPLFEIPYSFFVQVGQMDGNFYKAIYNGVTGFVKRDRVALMNGTPTDPYFDANFSVVYPNLYSEANSSSKVVSSELDRSTVLTYFGKKVGEFFTEESGTWYYVSAEINGEKQFGYVYSVFAYSSPTKNIYTNDESFDILSEDMLYKTANQFSSLSVGTKILLVFAIAIPSVLIIYFLVKPSKIMQLNKNKKQPKRQKKRVQHGDYFEFDESEL